MRFVCLVCLVCAVSCCVPGAGSLKNKTWPCRFNICERAPLYMCTCVCCVVLRAGSVCCVWLRDTQRDTPHTRNKTHHAHVKQQATAHIHMHVCGVSSCVCVACVWRVCGVCVACVWRVLLRDLCLFA